MGAVSDGSDWEFDLLEWMADQQGAVGARSIANRFGGSSTRLLRLTGRGLIEKQHVPPTGLLTSRGRCIYRITDAGRTRLEELRQMARDAKEGDQR